MPLRTRLWLLLSQAVNALAFGGDPDEPLSARAWREFTARSAGWDTTMYRIDRWLGMGHCRQVHQAHAARQAARNTTAKQ